LSAPTVNHVTEIGELAAAIVLTGNARRAFAAAHAGSENHFLPDANGGNFGTNLGDLSSDVAAGNVRKRDGNVGQAAAHPKVEMIQRASAHAHQHFVGVRLGVGHVDELQDVGSAVLPKDDRFHVWLRLGFGLKV
jgi:hypothetical protein